MASYSVNERALEKARRLIRSRQYVLDSDWGDAQPKADDENAFLRSHSWDGVRGVAPRPDGRRHRGHEGALCVRLRRLPPFASNGPDRVLSTGPPSGVTRTSSSPRTSCSSSSTRRARDLRGAGRPHVVDVAAHVARPARSTRRRAPPPSRPCTPRPSPGSRSRSRAGTRASRRGGCRRSTVCRRR